MRVDIIHVKCLVQNLHGKKKKKRICTAIASSCKEATVVSSFCCYYKVYKLEWDQKYIPSPDALMRITMKGGLSKDTGRPWVRDPVKDLKNTHHSLVQVCPNHGRRAIICATKLGKGYLCTEQWRASLNP